jgi:putative ABC transport system substrate-binding protein
LAARAQQATMPVVGYLSGRSAESDVSMLAAFRRGLNETGYTEGRNLAVEYRFADGRPDRVPALFTELTGRHVAVLVLVGASIGDDRVLRFLRSSQIPSLYVGSSNMKSRTRAGRLHGHLRADLDHSAGRYMEEIRRIVG